MFDPLMGTGNYSAISATLKSIDYNVTMTFILNNNKKYRIAVRWAVAFGTARGLGGLQF